MKNSCLRPWNYNKRFMQNQALEQLVSNSKNIALSRLAGDKKFIYPDRRKINNFDGSARS